MKFDELRREYELLKKWEDIFLKENESIFEGSVLQAEYLTSVHREIRTNLNVIVGGAALLNETDLASENCSLGFIIYLHFLKLCIFIIVKSVTTSSELLVKLIDQAFDISKFGSGTFELNVKPFGLAKYVNEIISPFEIEARKKGLDFKVELPELNYALLGDCNR